ncbi:MAG: PLP-dependent aminotransferase family protein [Acetobacteraceae bacterium]|nr:PLP-dependent aminotransferase family protein [Pseudomonadota bacterium]
MHLPRVEHGWAPRLDVANGPLYRAIAAAIGKAVETGELRPGERLPTHRALAEQLGVDLTTITRAYAEARRRGLLEATVGRGTFVRTASPAAPRGHTDGPVDLSMNLPPLPVDPSLPDLLRHGLGRLLSGVAPAELLTYRASGGTVEEAAAGANWLRPTLGDLDPARVLVSPGAQPALAAILATITTPGDAVLADQLSYPGIRGAAAQAGVRLIGIAADAQGMLPEAIDEACRGTSRVQALYCIPTIHNPTTVTMDLPRRRAIVDATRQHNLRIIEDDAYGLLPSDPLPALAALDPARGYHVSTMSKIMAPALRVAWLVAPDGQAAARVAEALRCTILMASPLLTGLVATWIREGTASVILDAIRRESAARQRMARNALPDGSFAAHPEGLHIWLRLPQSWDRRDFVAELRRQDGLAVVPSDAFRVDGEAPEAIRLSLGAAPDREALARALRLVTSTLQQERRTRFAGVV